MRIPRFLVAAAAAGIPLAAVHAAALVVTKSSVVVNDAVSTVYPKALPGAFVDYSILVNNPNGLLSGLAIGGVQISDTIPTNVVFETGNYGTSSGPVEFADGSLLGLGLLGSNLGYTFKGLADDTDSIEFYNGVTWLYHPTAGSDPNVRAIRVTLSGTQAPATSFRLRFRVHLK